MPKTSFKTALEFSAFRVLRFLFFLLPRGACLASGRVFGSLIFLLDRRHRRIALSNLLMAFGSEKSESELKKTARLSFRNFGEVTADILKLPFLGEEKIRSLITWEGLENLHESLDQGKGVLIFSAHFGNWEIGSSLVSPLKEFNVVARPLDNPLLERELIRLRRCLGARVIYKKQAAKQILQALRRNEIVAILIDQNVLRSEAVFVDFFGRAAATTPGLAAIALRTGSPVLPVFCYPRPGHTYHIKFFKPLQVSPSGDPSRDVLKITGICTKIIEEQIRQGPAYWFWFHKRWNTRPPGEAGDGLFAEDERRGVNEIQ